MIFRYSDISYDKHTRRGRSHLSCNVFHRMERQRECFPVTFNKFELPLGWKEPLLWLLP
jgi:hypothetical protein